MTCSICCDEDERADQESKTSEEQFFCLLPSDENILTQWFLLCNTLSIISSCRRRLWISLFLFQFNSSAERVLWKRRSCPTQFFLVQQSVRDAESCCHICYFSLAHPLPNDCRREHEEFSLSLSIRTRRQSSD